MRTKTRMDYAIIKKLEVPGVARLGSLYVGGVPSVAPDPMLQGGIFYLDGNNGNNNYPATLEAPIETFSEAFSRCTDDKQDIIYVLDYWQPANEDWPISVNKSMVHIIGLCPWPVRKWTLVASAGNYPCFDVVANYVIIEGLGLYPTSGYPCVTADDGAESLWLRNILFYRGSYGVELAWDDMSTGLSITDCYFINSLSAGGIYIADNPAFCYIARNIFDRHDGISIDIEHGGGHIIVDNRFSLKADTQGLAITLASAVSRALVDGNHAAYGAASGGTSPYEDEGTVTTNNWGLNYKGKAAIDPA